MLTAINTTDILHITALSSGAMLLSTSLSGAASIGDIFRHVKAHAESVKGIVTLRIRNSTQGWVRQHTLVLNRTMKNNLFSA